MDVRAIQKQRERLKAERETHVRNIAEIDIKLSELDIAERVVANLPEIDDEASPPPMTRVGDVIQSILRTRAPQGPGKDKQVKEMLLQVLQDAYPDALSASELRERALERFGKAVNPNTLTVTLVRYRHEKLVTVANKLWRYIPQPSDRALFEINEAADDSPASDASAASDRQPRGEARGGGP